MTTEQIPHPIDTVPPQGGQTVERPIRSSRVRRLPSPRESALGWAELVGLCALAIAEPLFEELRQGLEVFPTYEIRGREAVTFAVAMVMIPPTLLWLLELAAGLAWARARRFVHAGFVAFLIASVVWQAAHGDSLVADDFALFALAASFAGALALYLRTRWLPAVTQVMALAGPIVVISFLAGSPTNRLFGADDVGSAHLGGAPPVVLVIFDELPLATLLGPDGRIDSRLFPNFARLAQDSTWYRNARTVADQSIHAIPAILSGQYPEREQIPTRADYPRNIFTLLGGKGPAIGSEALSDLCTPSLCADQYDFRSKMGQLIRIGSHAAVSLPFGIAESTGDWLYEQLNSAGRIPPSQSVLQAVQSPPDHRPRLVVAHQILPHVPWKYLPSGQTYPDPGPLGLVGEAWSGPDYLVKLGFQRHVLQAQFVDRELGRLMRVMKRSGLYDEAVLAVAADHGAAFLPDFSRRGVSPAVSGWVLPVPLLVKGAGQAKGRVDPTPMRTIDILPTLAKAAGTKVPWKVDGRPPGAPRDPAIDRTYLSFVSGAAEIDSAVVDESLRRAMALRDRLLPGGDPFALGGSARLIGRPAKLLATRPIESQLDYPAFADVYPDAKVVNGFASGSFPRYGGSPGDAIAFSLNGRIAATGEVFGKYEQASFATVVPVRFLRPGRNRFEVYPIPSAAAMQARGR